MFKLYKHQQIALSYLRLYSNFALFMEQGCGKTLPCLCRALELARQGKIRSVLVIAPKAAMGAWTRDIELFNEDNQKVLLSILTVVNYESVWRKTQYDKRWLKSPKYDPNVYGDSLLRTDYQLQRFRAKSRQNPQDRTSTKMQLYTLCNERNN